jgi:hypothetical protein
VGLSELLVLCPAAKEEKEMHNLSFYFIFLDIIICSDWRIVFLSRTPLCCNDDDRWLLLF